jgi:hypothetical protein
VFSRAAKSRGAGIGHRAGVPGQAVSAAAGGSSQAVGVTRRRGQGETGEATKVWAALLKGQAEYAAGKQETQLQKDARVASTIARSLQNEDLDFLLDTLDKQRVAYMAFENIRKTAELAELGINLAAEIQQIWAYSSENFSTGSPAGRRERVGHRQT